jgi:hypothetical protein
MDRAASQRPLRVPSTSIPRVDVLGVGISAIDMAQAVAEITRWVEDGEQRYVCVTGVHGVMEARHDPELLRIHNASGLTTPDGMPWSGPATGQGHRRCAACTGQTSCSPSVRWPPSAAGRRTLRRRSRHARAPRRATDRPLPRAAGRRHLVAAVPTPYA